jgi:outer membrane protein assembly factor BamB
MVHGLDTDAENVRAARKHIQSLGIYGDVSVDRFDGKRLPYIDNLVNILVARDLGDVPMNEVMRVLTPNGVAYVGQDGRWNVTTKPRPEEMDEWTHYLHDATNNAVSHDTLVGPLRHLQWIGSPRYSRHHDHMSAASAMVSAGGRLFYIFDHASPMSIQLPSQWELVARDAFNGTVLWRRPIEAWHTQMFKLKSGPAQLTRRLVAAGNRVYATLGLESPVTLLDAATGKTVRTYAGTEKTEEIILSDGTLFLLINDSPLRQPPRPQELNYVFAEGPRRILAVDAESGRVLWNQAQSNVLPLSLTVDSRRVLFADGEKVVCLRRSDGQKLWQSEPLSRRKEIPTFFGPTLVIYGNVVLFSGGSDKADERNRGGGTNTMYALAADTGRTLWTAEHPPSGYKSAEDILVVDGLVWTPSTTMSSDSGVMIGRDPQTGKVEKEFLPDVETHWFHHRCHRAKATDKYLLTSRTGIEFVDPKTEHWECHHWVRGACLYGIMPANGLIYNPPHPCACYLESKLYGFNALASTSPSRQVPSQVPEAGRLERGPAYAGVGSQGSGVGSSADWPTHRHDAARSGYTETAVPARLKQAWQTELGGRLSGVVVAGGKVFLASIDTHTVHALDAKSGEAVWSYTTGGRVDSPPTIHEGRVLFGSADGYVYCLRASDGALAWRFRAAPVDRRMGVFEQLESVWPVHGSVLLRDGELWCVAGRSMFVDGGLRLLRLNPETGRLIAERVLDDKDPASGKNLQVRLVGLNMPVALPDVLSYDGKYVYMRSQRFDREGVRQEIEVPTLDVSQQFGEGRHMFCPTGFLDDVWWHRSYWVYGRVWKSGAGGYSQAGRATPAGRPMVFNDTTIYGYGRKPQYYRWTTPMEYQLFATAKQPQRGGGAKAEPPQKSQAKQPARRKMQAAAKKKRTTARRPPASRITLDWTEDVPVLVRAMVLADKTLFIAGPPDVLDEEQSLLAFDQAYVQKQIARQAAAFEGAEGAHLWAVSTTDGTKLAEYELESVPVFDGMAAAGGRLYMSTTEGKVICFGADN